MATFGSIASAAPNVLFDAAKLDRDVQGFQRNQLLMQNAQQDQRQQTYQRDTEARIGLARELVGLPEAQAAAEWGARRQRLQSAGLGTDLPEQFPGLDRLKAVAASDLTTFQRLQIEEKARQTAALGGLFGTAPAATVGGSGGAGYTPVSMSAPMPVAGAAPVSSTGNVRADNADAAARRQWAMDNLSGTDLEAELAAISQGRVTSLTGRGPGTQYRAPDGVNGVYAGVPAARPGVPVLSSGQAPASPAVASGGGQAPAAPVAQGPRVNAQGFTDDQVRELRLATVVNPNNVPSMMAAFRRENQGLIERARDDDRSERRFAAQQTQQAEANRRAEDAAKRQADAAQRAADAAERAARAAGVPSGYERTADGKLRPIPGGPADKPPETQATESERKAGSYLERMQGAEDLLQGMVRGGYDPSNTRDRIANATPLVGNFLTSQPGQQYLNAAAEWARAKLRLESGAVIGEDEARQEARTYFPMPGDSAETIAQKQVLRDNAMQAIRRQAGRSAPAAQAAPNSTGGQQQAAAPQGGGWSIRPVQ